MNHPDPARALRGDGDVGRAVVLSRADGHLPESSPPSCSACRGCAKAFLKHHRDLHSAPGSGAAASARFTSRTSSPTRSSCASASSFRRPRAQHQAERPPGEPGRQALEAGAPAISTASSLRLYRRGYRPSAPPERSPASRPLETERAQEGCGPKRMGRGVGAEDAGVSPRWTLQPGDEVRGDDSRTACRPALGRSFHRIEGPCDADRRRRRRADVRADQVHRVWPRSRSAARRAAQPQPLMVTAMTALRAMWNGHVGCPHQSSETTSALCAISSRVITSGWVRLPPGWE